MAIAPYARWMLAQETRSLLARLDAIKPFALLTPMVPAAALQPGAQTAIEQHLLAAQQRLRHQASQFLDWLKSPAASSANAAEGQRRFTFLRLRFNVVLTQFDLFSEVITQRGESENGVWLAGLDVVCAETLRLSGNYYSTPPVICYLDRGPGAAIRRAGTRLPGGGANPVAIVRIPRERMIGSGIASSLVHEIGHQAAALLDLAQSLTHRLRELQREWRAPAGQPRAVNPWYWWQVWISEIVADFWAVSRVGVASTLGLIGVLSLPRPMVMQLNGNDPHPVPWLRVKLSCAIGGALYPHPQWQRLSDLWDSYYPLDGQGNNGRFLQTMAAAIGDFVRVLIGHRPQALRGKALCQVFEIEQRQPEQLKTLFHDWLRQPKAMYEAAPSLVFAVMGQARLDGLISPERESAVLARLLTHWALRNASDTSASCAYTRSTLGRLRSEPDASQLWTRGTRATRWRIGRATETEAGLAT